MFDLIQSIFGIGAASGRASFPPDHDYWYRPRGIPTTAGVEVNEHSALMFSTVFSCVSKLAKTIGTLPFHTWEATGKDNRELIPDHWLTRRWRDAMTFNMEGNPEVTGLSGREAEVANRTLWGNSYFEISWTNRGRTEATQLQPLPSMYVKPKRNEDGLIFYKYREYGKQERIINSEDMLVIPGLTLNGVTGLSVVGYQREAIGLAIASARHASAFFGNAGVPGLVLERPNEAKRLPPEAAQRLVDDWDDKFIQSGVYRTALLEEGTTAHLLGMPMKDAQFLEGRQFERIEILGIFDVQPSKIHDQTRSTYSNAEQEGIDWSVDSIMPHCVRIEQALRAKFLLNTPFFTKHNLDGLMRGDTIARGNFYQKMIRVGMSVNQILAKEDSPGIGADGDVPLVSADLVPLSRMVNPPDTSQVVNVGAAFGATLKDAIGQLVNREVKAIKRAWQKHAKQDDTTGFFAWLDEFYAEQHSIAIARLEPIVQGIAAVTDIGVADAMARMLAAIYASTSLAAVRDCVETDPAALPGELEKWQTTKPAELASLYLARLGCKEKERGNDKPLQLAGE